MSDLETIIKQTMQDHLDAAKDYERGGNARGAMQLRAVANLLAAILEGRPPHTVCPWERPK